MPQNVLKAAENPGLVIDHHPFVSIEIKQLADGIYPFVKTGDAVSVLPFRTTSDGGLEVCLATQYRVDSGEEPVIKACGGYNRGMTPQENATKLLKSKFGIITSKLVYWHGSCLGFGEQYQFSIDYGFILIDHRDECVEPEADGIAVDWMPIEHAIRLATAKNTTFFDDATQVQLMILQCHDYDMVQYYRNPPLG